MRDYLSFLAAECFSGAVPWVWSDCTSAWHSLVDADLTEVEILLFAATQRQIITITVILLLGTATVMIGWNLMAAWLGISLADASEMRGSSSEMMSILAGFATIGIAAAGTGWCASSMLASTGGRWAWGY